MGFLEHGWVLLARTRCSSIAAPGRYLERNSNNSIMADIRRFFTKRSPKGCPYIKPSVPSVLCLNGLGHG